MRSVERPNKQALVVLCVWAGVRYAQWRETARVRSVEQPNKQAVCVWAYNCVLLSHDGMSPHPYAGRTSISDNTQPLCAQFSQLSAL